MKTKTIPGLGTGPATNKPTYAERVQRLAELAQGVDVAQKMPAAPVKRRAVGEREREARRLREAQAASVQER